MKTRLTPENARPYNLMRRPKRLKRYLNPEEGANAYNAIATAKQAFERLEAMGMLKDIRNNPEAFTLLHQAIKGINNALREWGNDKRVSGNAEIKPRL